MKEESKNLTPKQKRFCEEYIVDLNGTQAAIRAGYSESGAATEGARLLINANTQQYLQELKRIRSEKVEVTALDVLRELKNFIYSDITQVMELSFKEVKELPEDVRRLIASFEKSESEYKGVTTTTYKIKFINKMKAFEMLNKHIGFYDADNQQKKSNITIFELPNNGREADQDDDN